MNQRTQLVSIWPILGVILFGVIIIGALGYLKATKLSNAARPTTDPTIAFIDPESRADLGWRKLVGEPKYDQASEMYVVKFQFPTNAKLSIDLGSAIFHRTAVTSMRRDRDGQLEAYIVWRNIDGSEIYQVASLEWASLAENKKK